MTYNGQKEERQYNGQKEERQYNGQKEERQYNGLKEERQYNGQKGTKGQTDLKILSVFISEPRNKLLSCFETIYNITIVPLVVITIRSFPHSS
jgi:hypothetical protein